MLQWSSPWEHLGGGPPTTPNPPSCQQHAFALVSGQGELGPHSHARSAAHTSTSTNVAVPLGVAEPLAVPPPLLVPVVVWEGDLLPPPDAVPLRVALVVLEVVGDRVRVELPLGDLEVDALGLMVPPPLPVAVAAGEREGGGRVEGEAQRELEGGRLKVGGFEGVMEGEACRVPELVGVVLWVAEPGR